MKAVAQVATGRSNVETAAEEALSEPAAKPTSGESPTELEVRNRPQAAVLAHRVRARRPRETRVWVRPAPGHGPGSPATPGRVVERPP